MENIVKGFLIGISIAAPVGPIGVLCIRRTLADGRKSGLLTGLGAATADSLYGSIAAFGLTFISVFLVEQQVWLRLVGGLFLCYLAVRTFLSKPNPDSPVKLRSSGRGAYVSTFFLTVTNPLTILSFAAVFAGLGLSSGETTPFRAISLVTGVFLGSAAWWFLLASLVGSLRMRFDDRAMTWVNRISGVVILGFGIAALASLL